MKKSLLLLFTQILHRRIPLGVTRKWILLKNKYVVMGGIPSYKDHAFIDGSFYKIEDLEEELRLLKEEARKTKEARDERRNIIEKFQKNL